MKLNNIFGAFILISMISGSCRNNISDGPLTFKSYEENPVLSPGEPGSWDELFLWNPQIIYVDGLFYLYYLGGNISGRMAIGLATSTDGYNFIKYGGNPILSPDDKGFDAYTVGPGIVVKQDSIWLMYYNAQEMIAFAPGPYAGMASSNSPAGPWKKRETPVIASGTKGEWDAGFIIPSSVLLLEDGSFIMFYSGGEEVALFDNFFVGLATSADGITWEKYNDEQTTQRPFSDSDPVLMPGKPGEWDDAFVWMANVTKSPEGYRMYYSGAGLNLRQDIKYIGYATSKDGIHWEKYRENPVYQFADEWFIQKNGGNGYLENPSILYHDTLCFMYYDCGPFQIDSSYLGLATAPVPSTNPGVN